MWEHIRNIYKDENPAEKSNIAGHHILRYVLHTGGPVYVVNVCLGAGMIPARSQQNLHLC